MHSRLFIALPLLLISLQTTTVQGSDPETQASAQLQPMTVVANRQPRDLSEVAGTVTVIDDTQIRENLSMDIKDALRYEPGIDVESSDTRFGFSGFRIRGIGDNRTLVLVDNVPTGDRFALRSFADTGRGLLELDLVSRMELLRGPASTIHGSKALGGVVSITQLDAEDLLQGAASANYLSQASKTSNASHRLSLASAADEGEWKWLAAGAFNTMQEFDIPKVPADLDPDQLRRDQGTVLLRSTRKTRYGSLRMTLNALEDRRDSIAGTGLRENTTALTGEDTSQQWRAIVDGQLNPLGFVSRGHWRAWHQSAETSQETFEERTLQDPPVDLYRRFDLDQRTSGLGVDLESSNSMFGRAARTGYGLEVHVTELEQKRTGLQTNLDTGESSQTFSRPSETFPVRDFPRTQITEIGVYLHEEVQLWQAGPVISPGIRFEYYALEPRNDTLFKSRYPDTDVVKIETTSWIPKLGLLWPVGEQTDFFAQYAKGFRSPPFGDVNIGLDIRYSPGLRAKALPNPDLKAEKGHSVETGVRWTDGSSRLEMALFHNQYRDFIETRASLGRDPDDPGVLLFQSQNRDRVTIEGLELRFDHRVSDTLSANVSLEMTRGYDRNTDERLPEINPPRAVVALAWQPLVTGAEYRLVTTAARGQQPIVNRSGDPLFATPGYATFDLLANWYPNPDLRIGLGLLNVGDIQYWRNASVSGRSPDDSALPLLAESRRSLVGSLSWRF